MKSYIQILGTGVAGDNAYGIMAYFDNQKYLFGVGEGMSRQGLEVRGRTWPKLSTIFMSRTSHWETNGGLYGMLLTLASAGNKKVDIYGGKNLTHLLASARNFVFRMSTRVETHEVDEWSQRFKDENLEVDYVFATTSNEDLSDNHNNKILHDSDNMRLVQKVVAEMFKTGQSLGVAVPNSLDDKIGSKDDARLSSISKKTFHQLSLPMGTATATTITGGRDGGFSGDDYDFDADMQEETEAARSRPLEPCKRAITFICQGLNVKGRFQPQEASRLGCTPGSDFGLLHEGQTIQLSSDDFVRPHQVVSKERTGSIFIVVDCPTAAYIKSLVSNPKFVPHYKNELNSASGSDGSHVKCIIHKLGQAAVLESAMYNAWMAKFGGETQHVIICPEYSPTPVTYKGAALSAARLSMLDPDVFRIPLYKNTALRDFHEIKAADYKCTIGKSMQIIDLEPAVGVNESELSLSFDHTDPEGKFVKGLNKLVEYKRACLDIKEKVANGGGDNSASLPHSAVRITTLGTAASLPSRYRNVSSTMISIDVKGGEGVNGRHCPRGILLDAGEGTYGQMTRRFPEEELLDILAGLECIFISHMHADHHLGVVRILIERERAIKGLANDIERRRLFIVGPTQYWTWLTELSGVQDIGNLTRDFCWIDSKDLLADCGSEKRCLLLDALELADFTTVSVEHCPNSYALCLKSAAAGSSSSSSVQDWKIVFSGDCRPSLELVKVGIDADLLIHEATFECSDQIEAEDRRHCTTLEAIIVGKRMRAKYVLMNHFSGRYPSIPKFEDAAAILLQDTKMGVCAAFDCMSFTMDQLPRLPLFIPAVRLLYPKNVKEMVDVDTVDIESDVSANAVGRGGGKRGKGGRDAGYGRGRGGGGGGRGQGRKRERRHDHEDDLELPVGGGTKFDWIRMERNNEKK